MDTGWHFKICYVMRFVDEKENIYVHSLNESICLAEDYAQLS